MCARWPPLSCPGPRHWPSWGHTTIRTRSRRRSAAEQAEASVIKVGVLGAKGRMGSLVSQTVRSAADLELTAEVDVGDSRDALQGCDVVVDFTSPAAVMDNLAWCVRSGLNTVVGTSGFDGARLAAAAELVSAAAGQTGEAAASRPRVLVVPNFSVGAVLMMRFAEQ